MLTNKYPETADIETSSDDYAKRFSGEIGAWLLKVQEQATLKLLQDYPKATVLDVGGGHGQLTKPLIDSGYQVTVLGSDPSCQNRIKPYLEANLCQFQVGDVLALPYANNSFDVVISYRFLAHVDNWEKFLQELTRVSKKAIVIDYPTKRSFNAIAPYLFKVKKGIEKNTRPFICYSEAQIINHLKSLNFTQGGRYAQFCLPMVLHRMLANPQISSILEGLLRVVGLTYWFGSPVILSAIKTD